MTKERNSKSEELIQVREKLRPTVVAEPKWTQGPLWPTLAYKTNMSQEDMLAQGVMSWTRISMAIVNTSGEALGWERLFELLDDKQRPVSERKADRLMREFNINGDSSADSVNLLVTWAKGDLFSWHRHPYVTEEELQGIGDWCPQVQAVEEMGMGEKSENMHLWCDYYDSHAAQRVHNDIRMVHGHCLSAGNKYCMFYIDKQEDPSPEEASTAYEVIKHFNDKRKKELDINPDPDYFEGLAAPRNIEGWTEAEKLKDGVATKAKIAFETMLAAGNEYGWSDYIDLMAKEHSWGYRQEAFKLKRDFNITGDGIRDAGNLIGIGLGLQGFDHHSLIKYTPDVIEGIATKCQVIDSANEVGMSEEELKDLSLWCDFYHSHKAQVVNDNFQVTHTHCLGCGDKYCRFIVTDKRLVDDENLIAVSGG